MDAVELISLYSTLFYVSMALCLLGLVLAIVFFFVFDIRKVYTQLTGRGKEQLMQRMGKETPKTEKRRNTSGLKSRDLYTVETDSAEPVQQEQNSTTVLSHENTEEATTVLSSPVSDDAAQTAVLQAREPPSNAAAVSEGPGPAGSFEIFESVIEIHTDEFI